jgi:hypothetical protein
MIMTRRTSSCTNDSVTHLDVSAGGSRLRRSDLLQGV